MKYILKFIIMVTIFLFTFNASFSINHELYSSSLNDNNVTISIHKSENKTNDGKSKIFISYPVLEGLQNNIIQNEINLSFKNKIFGSKSEEQYINDFLKNSESACVNSNNGTTEEYHYHVTFFNNHVLSIRYIEYTLSCGAPHSYSQSNIFSMNLTNGSALILKDLFDEENLLKLEDISKDIIWKEDHEEAGVEAKRVDYVGDKVTSLKLTGKETFIIQNDNFIFSTNLFYETPGHMVDGNREVSVKGLKIVKYLKSDVKQVVNKYINITDN